MTRREDLRDAQVLLKEMVVESGLQADVEVLEKKGVVRVEIECGKHHHVVSLNGDVFIVTAFSGYMYTDFITHDNESIFPYFARAFSEIYKICNGRAVYNERSTLFRRRKVYDLKTADGDEWRFYKMARNP